MKKIFDKKTVILIIPFIFGIWGINYGLPMHLLGDEESLIGGALKMIELRNIIPISAPEQFALLYYPPVIPYLQILASLPAIIWQAISLGFDIGQVKANFATNLDSIWLSARTLSALVSVAVVYVTYKLAREFYNEKTAWIAAALLSTSFYHVLLAHWARHWVFTAFFSYLVILLAVYIVKGKLKRTWLLGVVGGIGLGTSYLTVFGMGVAALILWFNRKKVANFLSVIVRNISLYLIIGFVLIYINFADFLRLFGGDLYELNSSKTPFGWMQNFGEFAGIFYRQELVLSILALFALIFVRKYIKVKLLIAVYILFYATVIYTFFHFENRYVYLLIPIVAIVAADGLKFILDKVPSQKLSYIILALIFLWPVASVLRYNSLLSQDDTREQAIGYIEQNIDGHFLISSDQIALARTKESLDIAHEYGRINSREKFIRTNYEAASSNFDKQYNYQNIHFWSKGVIEPEQLDSYLDRAQPQYFILDYWQEEEIDEFEQYLRDKGELVKIFSQSDQSTNYDINGNFKAVNTVLWTLNRLGPTVEIYKL